MKKIIAISVLTVMLFSLVSCGGFTKTYESDGFSIELPITFIDAGDIAHELLESTGTSYDGRYTAYTSVIEGITIIAATADPYEDGDLYDFAEMTAESFGTDPYDIFYINGNPAFECYQDMSVTQMQAIIVCHEVDGEIWVVTAFCDPAKYDDKKETMITYLESVEIG